MRGGGTGDIHFMKPGEVQHIGSHTHHRIGADRLGVRHQPLNGLMAGQIEYITEFFDLPAHQGFQGASKAANCAHRVGNVAEDKFLGDVARVHMAVKFLRVARTGKRRGVRSATDAGADE